MFQVVEFCGTYGSSLFVSYLHSDVQDFSYNLNVIILHYLDKKKYIDLARQETKKKTLTDSDALAGQILVRVPCITLQPKGIFLF